LLTSVYAHKINNHDPSVLLQGCTGYNVNFFLALSKSLKLTNIFLDFLPKPRFTVEYLSIVSVIFCKNVFKTIRMQKKWTQ